MNILNYLESSFEDFADAPVGADQLAHNATGAPGQIPGAAPEAETNAPDSLEIPESVGPAVIASSDEVQAAAIVEDPGHSEAEQMANAASDTNTSVIEQADVAPGETPEAGAEGTGDEPAAEPDLEAGLDNDGEQVGDGDVSAGSDLGDEGDLGASEETGEPPVDGGDELGGDEGLGDTGGEEPGDDTDLEATGDAGPGEEEDGLSEEPIVEEGSEDGLGDDTGGDTSTDETETDGDDAEAGNSEGEAEEETGEEEGSEETGDEGTGDEFEESTDEEAGGESEEESEAEAGGESDDDDDGVEYDVPDVDTEVTDEEVADAEEDAEEAAAEDEALDEEIVDTTKSVSELEEDEVAVEEFIGVLAHGIRTKNYPAQTVHLAQSKLLRLSAKFGCHAPVIPSMEDYNSKNLDAYFTNSLESFSDFLKKIRHARKNFFDNFAKKMNDKIHLKAVETEIDALNKVCDQQIVRLKALEMPEAITVKVPAGIRHPQGVVKGMTAELQWMNDVAAVFKVDHTFIKGLADILKKAVAEGDSTKATELANKALKLGVPAKKYPASAFSGSTYLGEFKFVKNDVKPSGNMAEDMKTLAARAIPELQGSIVGAGTGPAEGTFKKADLIKMLQLCKVMIGLSRGTAGSTGKDIVDQLDAANRSGTEQDMAGKKAGDKEEQRRGEAAMSQLTSQFWYSISKSLDNYSGFQYHLIAMVDCMLRVVMRAK